MNVKITSTLLIVCLFLISCSTGMREKQLSYEEFIYQEYQYIQNDISKIREKLAYLENQNTKKEDNFYHELLSLQEHSTNIILYNHNKKHLMTLEHQKLISVMAKYKYVSHFLDYAIKNNNVLLLKECIVILNEGEKSLADMEFLNRNAIEEVSEVITDHAE